jgi:hypothetical protein
MKERFLLIEIKISSHKNRKDRDYPFHLKIIIPAIIMITPIHSRIP